MPISRTPRWRTAMPSALLAGCILAAAGAGNATPPVIAGCAIEPQTQCPSADLFGADLRNADLSGAKLEGANLVLADLRAPICPGPT